MKLAFKRVCKGHHQAIINDVITYQIEKGEYHGYWAISTNKGSFIYACPLLSGCKNYIANLHGFAPIY